MARKATKNAMTRKLDKVVSTIVRGRGRCDFCGSSHYLQCAHIQSRRFRSTRWDFNNLLCLCAACHRKGHDQPIWFVDECRILLGEERVNEIQNKSQDVKKWTLNEMQAFYEALKELEKHS